MRRWQKAVFAVMIVATVGGPAPFAASGAPPAPCAPQRLRIVELGTIPELVQAGKPVQLWKVTLKSLEDCLTVLEVREPDRIVGRSVPYLIKAGEFSYTISADSKYQFQVQEHCLKVLMNVADAWAPVDPLDPQKLFCVKYRGQPPPAGWSLK